MKKKTIIIWGHYGVPNWGDEAILSGILSKLNKEKWNIYIVGDDHTFLKKQYPDTNPLYPPPFGIKSLFRGGFKEFIDAIKKAHIVAYGGGSLFQNNPPKAFILWSYYLFWSIVFKKKVIFLGQSFEEFKNKNQEKVLSLMLKPLKFIGVRDKTSQKYLEKIGVESKKIYESCDSAFFLTPEKTKRKKTGITLCFREGDLSKKKEKEIIKTIQKCCPKESIQVLSLQQNNHDYFVGKRFNLSIIIPNSLDEVFEVLSRSKIVITTRLHGGILSSLCDTPFIAISTRPKLKQIFGTQWSMSKNTFCKKEGIERIKELYSNLPASRKKVSLWKQKQQKSLKEFFPFFLQD